MKPLCVLSDCYNCNIISTNFSLFDIFHLYSFIYRMQMRGKSEHFMSYFHPLLLNCLQFISNHQTTRAQCSVRFSWGQIYGIVYSYWVNITSNLESHRIF